MIHSVKTTLPAAGAAALVLALSLVSSPALAQDAVPDQAEAVAALNADVKKGEKVFRKCKACHVVDKEKNRVGPHLMHLLGRHSGSVEGYKYTDANKNSGVTWTVETLQEYLKDPKAYIPGTKMAFAGLKKDDEINDVIAYIFEAGGGAAPAE